MTKSYRNLLTWFVTFIGGFYFFLEFVLPKKIGDVEFGKYNDQISNGIVVMGAMAIGLGVVNILKIHGSAVIYTRKNWISSLALILGFLLMIGFESANFVAATRANKVWMQIASWEKYSQLVYRERLEKPATFRINALVDVLEKTKSHKFLSISENSSDKRIIKLDKDEFANSWETVFSQANDLKNVYLENPQGDFLDKHKSLEVEIKRLALATRLISEKNVENSIAKSGAEFLYNGLFVPLGAAMFSLLAFYIANAAYRSFRVRSVESVCMMFAALIVVLGQIPHGTIYISEYLPNLRLWLLKNISTPAFRAIYFGSAVAGLAMAVRMWLSLEQSPFAEEDSDRQAEGN